MNIAILGYGTVGGGVHALLKDGALGIHVRRVLDIRPIDEIADILTDNIGEILSDPQIDCVVETIGGTHPALSYVTAALRSGKSVATSNKELISHALAPLAEGAAMHGAQIRFSASVGGGIPWIDNVVRQKRSDRLVAIHGIVNGTTNYILDAMAQGETFEQALSMAQQMGYAELDATADLCGIDSQRKCAISASLAFDAIIEPEDIPALGIDTISKSDIDAFTRRGRVCKLMMRAQRDADRTVAYVEPTLLPAGTLAAAIRSNHNCITLEGAHTGTLSFCGQGAGRFPTAQNIVQDLLDIASGIVYRHRGIQPLSVDNTQTAHPYYVRTCAPNAIDAALVEEAWDDGIVTKAVSVSDMHAMIHTIRARDPKAFAAGIDV